MKACLLVIGYGNEVRGDDGVGPAVARAVADWGHPQVRTIAAHQLTPEMAEAIVDAERIVFVDARLQGKEVELERVVPAEGASWGHTSDPGWLLALALWLHEQVPPAWLVTIPAVDLTFGGPLSATAARGMAAALRWIESLLGTAIAKCLSTHGTRSPSMLAPACHRDMPRTSRGGDPHHLAWGKSS